MHAKAAVARARRRAGNRFPWAPFWILTLWLSGCVAPVPLGWHACRRAAPQSQNVHPAVEARRVCPRAAPEKRPSSPHTYTLRGCVTNLAGRVAIVRATGPVSRATTTHDNCFQIDRLPAGEFRVIVRHRDYEIVPGAQRVRIEDRDVDGVNFYAWPKSVRVGR